MSNDPSNLLEFGDYRLDRASRILTRSGEPVTLAPKTFDLLVALAESGGRLLTKQELIAELWPDVAVEEANLSFQISALRKALGEEGNVWIETVPKHGYRFTVRVHGGAGARPAEATQAVEIPAIPSAERAPRSPWAMPLMAVAALLLISAGALALKRGSSRASAAGDATPGPVRFSVEAPNGAIMPEASFPAISPDGRKLIYAATCRGCDDTVLYFRSLGSAESTPLAGTEGAMMPFWSPDSDAIGFFARQKLMTLDLDGNRQPVALCEAGKPSGGAWGRGGTILFADHDLGIRRVSAAGGGECQVEHEILDFRVLTPYFLPDGRHYLFSAYHMEHLKSGVYAGELGSSKLKHVIPGSAWHPQFTPPGLLLWSGQGELMAQDYDPVNAQLRGRPVKLLDGIGTAGTEAASLYSTSQNGVMAWREGHEPAWHLALYDRFGKRTVVGGEEQKHRNTRQLAVSPDGKWAILEKADPATRRFDLWLLNLRTAALSRLTTDPADDTDPVFAADSSAVVFGSNRKGMMDLYRKSIGDAQDEVLLLDVQRKVPESWTRNGIVLFASSGKNLNTAQKNVNTITAPPETSDKEPQPQKIWNADFYADEFHVSPDNQWVAYNSLESGTWQVYVAAFPSFTRRRQVSTHGGGQAIWRGDGAEIYYLSPEGDMMAVTVTQTSASAALETGVPRVLFKTRLRPNFSIDQYGVVFDGSKFLVVEPAHAPNQSINVLVNWQAALAPPRS